MSARVIAVEFGATRFGRNQVVRDLLAIIGGFVGGSIVGQIFTTLTAMFSLSGVLYWLLFIAALCIAAALGVAAYHAVDKFVTDARINRVCDTVTGWFHRK